MLAYRERPQGPVLREPHSLTSNHSGIDIGSGDGHAAVLGSLGTSRALGKKGPKLCLEQLESWTMDVFIPSEMCKFFPERRWDRCGFVPPVTQTLDFFEFHFLHP